MLNKANNVTKIEKHFRSRLASNPKSELYYHYILHFKNPITDIDALLGKYRKLNVVQYAEKIPTYSAFSNPNDPSFSSQWHLNETSDHDIDAPEAWSIEAGDDDVILAIIDSGIDWNHTDLAGSSPYTGGNIWINWTEYNGTSGQDDDGNGFVDDIRGWDFVTDTDQTPHTQEDGDNEDNNPMDFSGHGTHIAGIAAAITNNSTGVSGVAGGWYSGSSGCKLMAVRAGYVLYNSSTVQFDGEIVANAIEYAVDNGADVINCSFNTVYSIDLKDVVDTAIQEGVIIVVAAGNNNHETANYLNGRGDCLSVAATDDDDIKTFSSNYGTWVDVSAPGEDIYSTIVNGYGTKSGTSMAAPIVTGIIGLLKSASTSLNNSEIENIVKYASDDLDGLNPNYIGRLGGGRANAHLALLATQSPTTSGTISSTEVWRGNIALTGDVTINSTGKILILPGTTINVNSGKKIQVYGTLKAVGTAGEQITFDRSGASNWYGIKFEDSSDDAECILEHCVIKHCSYAVSCNYALPTIRNCEISYSIVGLYGYYCNSLQPVQDNLFKYNWGYGVLLSHPQAIILSGNDFMNYGTNIKCSYSDYSTTLRGNDVTESGASAQGILFDHSSPIVIENMIYNNNRYGVNCTNTSSPEFVHEDIDGENNVIADNAVYGVVADATSLPKLSDLSVADTAYNSIYSNRGAYDIYNANATSIQARGDWWGQNPPNTARFYGGVDYTNPLSEDPNPTPPSLSKSSAGEMVLNSTTEDVNKAAREIFERGYAYELHAEWQRAIDEYNVVIDKYPASTEASMALVHSGLCYDRLGQSESRKSEIAAIASSKSDYEVGGLAGLLDAQEDMIEKRSDEALLIYKDVAQRFPKGVLAQQALYDEWGVYFNVKQDESAARAAMDEYEKRFGEDETLISMKAAMGELTAEMLKRLHNPETASAEPALPKKFALHANYPNPFNPTTRIAYDLPEASTVRLEIFNVLGQRAALLLDERREAGRHIIVWDGRITSGAKAAAGLYFCRMTAGEFARTIKMTLLP